MKTRIGIVADDLTGAGDTAVQFVRAGWRTDLLLQPGAADAEVVAVTTDSRHRTAADASEAVGAAVRQLKEIGITRLYKKIDSTLRGQVRAEIGAAIEHWSPDARAIVCPAFPALNRTVVDGELRVNNVPVAKTDFGSDPVTPVTHSHIPTLIDAAHVTNSRHDSARALAERIANTKRVTVVDAETEDDLKRIADAIVLLGRDAVPVGSAGLAHHLARAWRAAESAPPAIVVVTSLQDAARRQAAAVEAVGADRYEPQPNDLVDDMAWARVSARVLDRLDEHNSTVLLTATADRSAAIGAQLIPRRFADLTARMVTRRPRGSIAGIVVTGGDGARALVDALGATAIRLHDEVSTGIPLGALSGGVADGLPIVTKAGGFGADDALVKAVERVRFRRPV